MQKICPISSPSGLHLLEWDLSSTPESFACLRRATGGNRRKSFHPSFHVVAKVDFACLKHWGYIF